MNDGSIFESPHGQAYTNLFKNNFFACFNYHIVSNQKCIIKLSDGIKITGNMHFIPEYDLTIMKIDEKTLLNLQDVYTFVDISEIDVTLPNKGTQFNIEDITTKYDSIKFLETCIQNFIFIFHIIKIL